VNEKSLYRRITRRETHQSRSTASAIVLGLVALCAAYAVIEISLALLGAPALLVSPAAAVATFRTDPPWLWWAGIPALVFGGILVVVAVIPTRRARHGVSHHRMAIVIDDSVIASALSAEARRTVNVSKNRVRTTVSRTRGLVTVTPTSGFPISREHAQDGAEDLLANLHPAPTIRARVTVLDRGVVGS